MWEAEADNVQAIAIVIIFVSKFLEPGLEYFDKPRDGLDLIRQC